MEGFFAGLFSNIFGFLGSKTSNPAAQKTFNAVSAGLQNMSSYNSQLPPVESTIVRPHPIPRAATPARIEIYNKADFPNTIDNSLFDRLRRRVFG